MEAEAYLDTHILMWLHRGDSHFFRPEVQKTIENHPLRISPIVLLELQYLHDVGKLHLSPQQLIEDLRNDIGLDYCAKPFHAVIQQSLKLGWTRDPFDRIITAHAALDHSILITKDETIRRHYRRAAW